MFLMCGSLFLRSRTFVYTAVAAVEANTGDGSVVYSCLVNVVNLGDIDVGHRTIVKKVVVVPTSAFEAMTKVTEAIVDPAVETYLRTPIAIIENISAVPPTPITRGPKKTNFRSKDPCAGHPVIVVITPGPITRGPDITLARAKRLLVDW
jgi:hypothetical protein